jgi:hypothetical protein
MIPEESDDDSRWIEAPGFSPATGKTKFSRLSPRVFSADAFTFGPAYFIALMNNPN